MSRQKVFISYSHRDRAWVERLQEHVAVLERWGLIHVWSDTRLVVGDQWEREIEEALAESKVAVPLISPAFFASRYIGEKEMPHIRAHARQGMVVLPLILRSCAWRLDEDLAQLLVRPTDGRPLADHSDTHVDQALAAFVYELAARLGRCSAGMATAELEFADRRQHASSSGYATDGPVQAGATGETRSTDDERRQPFARTWSGRYNDDYTFRITLDSTSDAEVTGQLEYLDDGTITRLEGRSFNEARDVSRLLSSLGGAADGRDDARAALVFRETKRRSGGRRIDFNGEYRAVVFPDGMRGGWFQGDRRVATFELSPDP